MDYMAFFTTLLMLQEATQAAPSSGGGGGGLGVIENVYALLKEGGLLMGALMVLYGQHKFYRYMIDKLEQKHQAQVTYLETEIKSLSEAARERARQDGELIRELSRKGGNE